jgi:hypothetical protein
MIASVPERMTKDVEPSPEQDDFLVSSAVVMEALASCTTPPESREVMRPRRLYEGEERYEKEKKAYQQSQCAREPKHAESDRLSVVR